MRELSDRAGATGKKRHLLRLIARRRWRMAATILILSLAPALMGGVAAAQRIEESYRLVGQLPRELTLEEAIAIGLEENPDVRAAQFRFQATRAGLLEAYGNFLPQLNLTAFLQKTSEGQVVVGGVPFPDPGLYTTYYQFDVTHRLFDAGRDFFRIGTAKAERRAADAQTALNRLATKAEIQRQYVLALAGQALREQSAREIRRSSSRLQLAQARFELGEVTRSDVLQGRIGVSEAEVERTTSETTLRTAKVELLRQMGVSADPDSVMLVERFDVFEPPWVPDSLVRRALLDHPAILLERARLDQRDNEHWIAKTAYLPNLQAGVTFASNVSDSSDFAFRDFQDRSIYSVSLSWELFGGFARYNQTSRARAEVRAAEEAVRGAELQVEAAVRQSYLDLLRLYQTQIARAEDVKLAEEQLVLAQERYRIGALSFPDLLDAQVTFTATETEYIRATYDFFVALADLEQASAQPVFSTGWRQAGGRPEPAIDRLKDGGAPADRGRRDGPAPEERRTPLPGARADRLPGAAGAAAPDSVSRGGPQLDRPAAPGRMDPRTGAPGAVTDPRDARTGQRTPPGERPR